MSSIPPVMLPRLPCDGCLNDPRCCTVTDRITAVYCEHHATGMHYAGGLYTVHHPVTRERYAAMLALLEVHVEQLEGSRPAPSAPN